MANKKVDQKKTKAVKETKAKTKKQQEENTEPGIFSKITDVVKTVAIYACDFFSRGAGFLAKSGLTVIAGLITLNALIAFGLTSLWSIILACLTVVGMTYLYLNWREKGDDSTAVQVYNNMHNAVTNSANAVKESFSMAA